MSLFERIVRVLTLRTAQVAQFVLVSAMLIIVANVILRVPWRPVPGTVELVEMSGAILLAMGVAYTAVMKGHIMVGVLVERFPPRMQAVVDFITSAIALFFTAILARETWIFAARMMIRGYKTAYLLLPIHPSIYLVAVSFIMLALVLLLEMLKAVIIIFKGSENG